MRKRYKLWIVERADGKVWRGPYFRDGTTFTDRGRFWYFFGSEKWARAAQESCGVPGKVRRIW